MAADDPWCQLVYTHECRDPVLITKDIYTFGRVPDCDGCFSGCKFMSGNHCYIMRDQEGHVWLHDTSTNGTLVNGKKIKSQSVKLCDKDEIKLVHRKDSNIIGFVYRDLKTKNQEEISLDNTEEYIEADDDTQKLPDTQEAEDDTASESIQRKRTHCETSSIDDVENPEAKRQHVDGSETTPQLTKNNSLIAENLLCNICQDIFHDCVSLQPCMHSYCASCYSQWMQRSRECPSCRLKVSRINRNHLVNNLVEAFLNENPGRKRSQDEIDEMNKKNKITSDMLKPAKKRRILDIFTHDSSGSSDDSMSDTSGSDNSFIDDDDDDDSDGPMFSPFAGGTIPTSVAGLFGFLTHSLSNTRTPVQICRQCPSDSSSSSNTPPTVTGCDGTNRVDCTNLLSGNSNTTSSNPPSGSNSNTTSINPPSGSNSNTTSINPPSGSNSNTTSINPPLGTNSNATTDGATPPPYVCPPNGSHILCLCCMRYMPDRRTHCHDAVPNQTCCVCNRAFCHVYWGCHGCRDGCLKEFKDFTFDHNDININNNTHETTIFKSYLSDKNIPLEDVLKKCLEKLESKEYKSKDAKCESSSSVICKTCAVKNFQELCYQYRRDIPRNDLPGHVTSRDDCYWGKNCRTQRKPHHAGRFNHICEQKRFK